MPSPPGARLGTDAIYCDSIDGSPLISRILENATLISDLKTETDYSYTSEQFAGPGYFLAGDAACFLDPLLSSGVHLATFSGMLLGGKYFQHAERRSDRRRGDQLL